MPKKKTKIKKVSLSPIVKAIDTATKQLKAAKKQADVQDKALIDGKIQALENIKVEVAKNCNAKKPTLAAYPI